MQDVVALHLESLEDAIDRRDAKALMKVVGELHYTDLVQYQETLSNEEEIQFFVTTIGVPQYAEVLADLPEELIETSLFHFQSAQQQELFGHLCDDDQAKVLRALSDQRKRLVLDTIEREDRQLIRSLLKYDEETAGGWMTTHFGAVNIEMTVEQGLQALKESQESTETLSRIFIVDNDGVLVGRVRFRDLAFSARDALIADISHPVEPPLLATADQEEVVMTIKKYDLLVAPVVDEQNRLLGVITHDDAMEIAEQESTEDMERLAGLTGEQTESSYLYTSVATHFRRRFLWLFGLALLAIASGYVMLQYESILSEVYMLSLFLPMVIAAGGNTGGQAAMMVIRAMALDELRPHDSIRVAWKEFRLGLLLGSILGISTFVICVCVLPLFRAPLPEMVSYLDFGVAVSLALGVQVMFSTLIGALLPLGAKSLKLDPAVIAAPAITTIVDVIGMAIYFTTAQAVLAL